MSMYTTPILYLNMGGEMLYVLQQRLTAQGIDLQKSTQVMDDVTAALLNPKILSTVFEAATPMSIACIRSTLECVALSSIMRLDKASMNKLFDLMIMLTKYQLTLSTGPREVVLLTLNHIDAMREIVIDENAHECVNLVHQMTVNLYGNMTMGKVWQTRSDCLKVLDEYCVRVSVLLRLGLQNNDGSFKPTNPKYNERYTEYQDMLNGLKLNDTDCENCTNIGSFALFGNRGTFLGRNIYSPLYGETEQPAKTEQQAPRDYGIRSELKMLEAQMGVEEKSSEKTFNLHIFTEDVNPSVSKDDYSEDSGLQGKEGPSSPQLTENSTANNDYKNTLNDKYADFVGGEKEASMNLLELLDGVE